MGPAYLFFQQSLTYIGFTYTRWVALFSIFLCLILLARDSSTNHFHCPNCCSWLLQLYLEHYRYIINAILFTNCYVCLLNTQLAICYWTYNINHINVTQGPNIHNKVKLSWLAENRFQKQVLHLTKCNWDPCMCLMLVVPWAKCKHYLLLK